MCYNKVLWSTKAERTQKTTRNGYDNAKKQKLSKFKIWRVYDKIVKKSEIEKNATNRK